MIDMSSRQQMPELMDDRDSDPVAIYNALHALARMNKLSMTAPAIVDGILQLPGLARRNVKLLDIGCGGGDVLIDVVAMLAKSRRQVTAVGIDQSPHAVRYARSRLARSPAEIEFLVGDAITAVQTERFDVVISSLFLHHMNEMELFNLFDAVRRNARTGMVMHDLRRSRATYGLIWLATHLLSRSPMVRHDGLASAQGALTAEELLDIATRVGLHACTVIPTFPLRLTMVWSKLSTGQPDAKIVPFKRSRP